MRKVTEEFYEVLEKDRAEFKPDWNKIFDCMDTKRSGKLLSMQFFAAASNRKKLVTNERYLQQAFKQIDKDGKGYFTAEEFKKAYGYGVKAPKHMNVEKVDSSIWAEADEQLKKVADPSTG